MDKPQVNGFHTMANENWEEIEIPVPWGKICGKWWGTKTVQPIVAIHGWQDNAGTFDNLLPLLCQDNKNRSFLCIDLPGHGKSSHFPDGTFYYIFWDGIHLLRRIVKHYKWQSVTILGHSLGGAIAFLYAATYPQEVDAFISIDIASPSVRDPSKMVSVLGSSVDKFLHFETLSAENTPMYDYEEMISIVHDAYKDSMSRKSCETMMRRGMYPGANTGTYMFARDPRLKVASLGFMTIDQVMEFAARIKCRVLNIRGDPGMAFDNPEYYGMVLDKMKESAEEVERALLTGTHHLHLNEETVVDVAQVIKRFLGD